ncbi:SpoIIE family protein phosphatase [Aeromonas veronii]|uniref:PP2C family protein-serine/threonine phosphatase n=1 Tax=Aeromonas veronii TaxID=654 RepID=UPI001F3A9ADE|nr:SpoIIE family protein phosphatase [Aeromonas veronii]MCF5862739.1 SpoIIE family protein phosphatase [Aeromonas veronii]
MDDWLRSAPATLQAVRELRNRLAQGLSLFQVSPKDQANWLLCFSELATNSVKHTAPPATRLWLTLKEDETGLSLILEDDGGPQPGLASAPLPDELQEGGYGLALVHQLFAEVHFSRDGERNRVTLRQQGPVNQLPVIAVIDDDKVMRALLTAYLHEHYRVESYADSHAALLALGKQPPALVLSDIEMEGIDDFLVKPITKQDLLLAVSRVLQRSQQLKSQWGEQLDQRMTSALRPLLPATSIGGYQLALQTRAATVGGGDFLLVKDRVLWLGDVMGHDAEAKFFAHAYAGYLRGLLTAHDLERAPARLLTILSNAVHSDPLLGATLLTTLCIELGNEGRVQWASAGHPAPWLVRPGTIRQVGVTGPLPGLRPDPHFVTNERQLKPGEILLFWTDGLLDSRDAEERQRWESQLKEICLTSGPGLEQLAHRIARWFDERINDAALDDMTLLLVACPGA